MSSKPLLDLGAAQAFGPTFISFTHSVFAEIELPTTTQNTCLIDFLGARDFFSDPDEKTKGNLVL